MALTKPILSPLPAWDADNMQTFIFNVYGGSQVVANRLVITEQSTGAVKYDQKITTFRYEHSIPSNSGLSNGVYYRAQIQTFDVQGNASPLSEPIQFWCYTTPLVVINNIPANNIIEASSYNFTASYAQLQGELLSSYQFNLYDMNSVQIATSGAMYDGELQYLFAGFNDNMSYFIELQTYTVNETLTSTGLIPFAVNYENPSWYAVNLLENLCADGKIQISSNIVIIEGSSNPDPPIYIDDKEVDLTDPDHWVKWDKGFNIKGNWTTKIFGRKFNKYKEIMRMETTTSTPTNPHYLSLRYMYDDYSEDTPKVFMDMLVYSGTQLPYYIKSNKIAVPTDEEYIYVWLRKVGGLYDLIIENIGVIV